ncbi:MAG: hypothetical protein J6X55_02075 [Victivallales bacterium]|nr:hypothetical protein [Victivallales bacterium]
MTATVVVPALILLLLGSLALLRAGTCLKKLEHDTTGGLPKEARWTWYGDLLLAFCLTNAGLFFATQCFRGIIPIAIATFLLCLLAAIGSQTRYNQTLSTIQGLTTELSKTLKRTHLYIPIGIFLILASELAVIILFLFVNKII